MTPTPSRRQVRGPKTPKIADWRQSGGFSATCSRDMWRSTKTEVDIHLNPKIGFGLMVRGQQKEVVTPGKNVKRYWPAFPMCARA